MSLAPFGRWPFPALRHGDTIFDAIDSAFDRPLDDLFTVPFSDLTPYSFYDPISFPFPSYAGSSPRVDCRETADAHVFKADLPGLKKDEVKVEVEDGRLLRISGQRSLEREDKSDSWLRVERSSGSFIRQFKLPENALVGRVKAAMENGVLTVTVPKEREEAKKPEIKSIEISG